MNGSSRKKFLLILFLCFSVVLADQLTAMSDDVVEHDACHKAHLDGTIEQLALSMCSYGDWIECPYFVFTKDAHEETVDCPFSHRKPMPPQLTREEYMRCCSMLTSKSKPTKSPTIVFHDFDQFIASSVGFALVIRLSDKIRSLGGRCNFVFIVKQARKDCSLMVREQLYDLKLHLIARRQTSEVIYGCDSDTAEAWVKYEFEESKTHWRWWQFHIANAASGSQIWFEECSCK